MKAISYNIDRVSKHKILILIFLNLCITLTLASILNIWIDEAFSLQTTGKGLAHAFRQTIQFERQAPLYFMLLTLWRGLNSSPFFARLFSIICVSLTIWITHKVADRYLKDFHPTLFLASVALNPFLIWAATEIRCYALVILLSSALLLVFFDGYLSHTSQAKSRFCYVLLAAIGLFTHYYLGFLLAANAFALMTTGRFKSFRNYLLDMTIVAVLFVAFVPVVLGQMSEVDRTVSMHSHLSSLEGIKVIYWNIEEYIFPAGQSSFVFLRNWVFRICILTGFILAAKKFRRITVSSIAIWAIVAGLFVSFTVFSARFDPDFLNLRHTAILFVPSILSVFSVNLVANSRKYFMVVISIMFLSYVITFADGLNLSAKNGDWKRVAMYIGNNEKPDEPILFFRNQFILPFSIYYEGRNRIVPLPGAPNLETFQLNLKSQVIRDNHQIVETVESVQGPSHRIWLVTASTEPKFGYSFNTQVLDQFTAKYCTVISDKEFYKSRVRLLQFNKAN